jgi:hypothetical protein
MQALKKYLTPAEYSYLCCEDVKPTCSCGHKEINPSDRYDEVFKNKNISVDDFFANLDIIHCVKNEKRQLGIAAFFVDDDGKEYTNGYQPDGVSEVFMFKGLPFYDESVNKQRYKLQIPQVANFIWRDDKWIRHDRYNICENVIFSDSEQIAVKCLYLTPELEDFMRYLYSHTDNTQQYPRADFHLCPNELIHN